MSIELETRDEAVAVRSRGKLVGLHGDDCAIVGLGWRKDRLGNNWKGGFWAGVPVPVSSLTPLCCGDRAVATSKGSTFWRTRGGEAGSVLAGEGQGPGHRLTGIRGRLGARDRRCAVSIGRGGSGGDGRHCRKKAGIWTGYGGRGCDRHRVLTKKKLYCLLTASEH